MADNTELSMNPFSIQDTMETGMGNRGLIEDFLSPETASTDPKDIEPIIKDAEPPAPTEPAKKPQVKEVPIPGEKTPEVDGKSIISNFLETDADDEDDIDEDDQVGSSVEDDNKRGEAAAKEKGEPLSINFSALSQDLFKAGVFTPDEDEAEVTITTPEELLERFQVEKRKGAMEAVENFLGQFGEDYRAAFEAVYVKGVNPKEYFGVYNNIVNFAELDLALEGNQVKVVRQALSDQGYESEDIDTEVERLKNYGDLESVATKHHKVLVKREAQKLQQLEAKAEADLQQKAMIKEQYAKNVQGVLADKLKAKEFDGIPLNPKLANELQDFLLVDKWKTASGETLTDFDRTILDLKKPENHSMKVKVALLLKILEKDPTLSTIQKKGVSTSTNKLFSEVARQVEKPRGAGKSESTGSSASPKSWFI